MENTNNGLETLTNRAKIEALFAQEQITKEDYAALNDEEEKIFEEVLRERFLGLKDTERDVLVKQLETLTGDEYVKIGFWENNHIQIQGLPSKAELARSTGLSRKTIHKHLKEYKTDPQYADHIEQFRVMTTKLLAKVFQQAVNGDMKAAKIYFDTMNSACSPVNNSSQIGTQNNYIQINGIVLSQENIKQLKPEQLAQIEGILKAALQAA